MIRAMIGIRTFLLVAALIGGVAVQATATPITMTYTVEASATPGLYDYDFKLTLDNNDGLWVSGQQWDWIVFGDNDSADSYQSFDTNGGIGGGYDWTFASFDSPITSPTFSGGGHNGPTLGIGANVLLPGWTPTAVGEFLSWSGSSSVLIVDGQLRWSALQTTGTPFVDFAVAKQVGGLVSVPDATSTLGLFIGVALLGFVAQRLWT